MATKKERVVFYVNDKIKQKLTKLAEAENRSLSNWLENLALQEIANSQKLKANSQQPIANRQQPTANQPNFNLAIAR